MKRLIAPAAAVAGLGTWGDGNAPAQQPEGPGLRAAGGRGARAGRGKPLPLPPIRGTRPGVAGRTGPRRAFRAGRVSPHRPAPYLLTLGSHAFYWFALRQPATLHWRGLRRCPAQEAGTEVPLPVLGGPRQLGRGFHGHRQPRAGEAPAGFSPLPPLVRRQGQDDPHGQHLGRDSAAAPRRCRASRPGPAAGRVHRRGARRIPGSDGLWRSRAAAGVGIAGPAAMICRLEVEKGGARTHGGLVRRLRPGRT